MIGESEFILIQVEKHVAVIMSLLNRVTLQAYPSHTISSAVFCLQNFAGVACEQALFLGSREKSREYRLRKKTRV